MKIARACVLAARTTRAALCSRPPAAARCGGRRPPSRPRAPPPSRRRRPHLGRGRRRRSCSSPTSRSTCPRSWSRAFEPESGIDLVTRAAGDGGTLTAKLSLTKDNPTGDVAFGVDNTFASRPLDEGVFATYEPTCRPAPTSTSSTRAATGSPRSTSANVCVNVDTTWFESEGLEPPQTLADLADPAYEDLFVTPGASTSSPGHGVPAEHDRGVRRGRLAGLLDRPARQRRQGGRRLGGRLLRRLHPGRRQGRAPDRRLLRLLAGLHGRRRHAPRPPRSSTPASARSSTPACSRVRPTPRGPRPSSTGCSPTRCRPRCRRAMYVFPVSDAVDDARRLGARTPIQPTAPLSVSPADIAANREQWLSEWTDVVTR